MEIREIPGGVSFEVRAKPRAKASRVVGVTEGALDVQIAAPPVDGAANEELTRALAKIIGVPRRAVTVARGEASRRKRVEVVGVSAEEARAALSSR